MIESKVFRPALDPLRISRCLGYHLRFWQICEHCIRLFLRFTVTSVTHLQRLLLINRPRRDRRLSRPLCIISVQKHVAADKIRTTNKLH